MRVAYVSADPGVPVFGTKGSSVHVQAVLRELVRRGAEVAVFAARTDGDAPGDLAGLEVHALPRPGGPAGARELALLDADPSLARTLAGHGPFDLVYERYSLWSTAAMAHARDTGVPGVLEVNSPLIQEQAEHRSLVHRAAAERSLAEAAGSATAVVCVSEPVAAWVRGQVPGAAVHVVPNGVDTARVVPSPPPAGPFTVGFTGTLKPWHGVENLVRAVARLAGMRLLVVGDGPRRAAVEELVVQLGVADRVELTGALGHDDALACLGRVHVAAAPYPEAEGYFSPLKVLEYLAAGLPVVASRSGQLPGLLTDGVDALLVPPGDVPALAAALDLLRADVELRARLGAAARRTAGNHSWAGAVEQILTHAQGTSVSDRVAV